MADAVIITASGAYAVSFNNGGNVNNAITSSEQFESIEKAIQKAGKDALILSSGSLSNHPLNNNQLTALLRARLSVYRTKYERERNAVIAAQKMKLKRQDLSDLEIIRLAALIDDYKRSLNRNATRVGHLIGVYYPQSLRRIRDYSGLAKAFLDGGTKNDELKSDPGRDMLKFIREQCNSLLALQLQIASAEREMESILMSKYPSFTLIATPKVAYRLIRKAGSFRQIALMSASNIQLMGAERALFRHLKNSRQKPPKYGILHEHPFFAKIRSKNHGKLARLIADKLIIAARLDYFGSKNNDYAKMMLSEIEAKAKGYE